MEIKEKLTTPYVKLDKENCTLTFMGRSYPEHPALFYDPIIEKVEGYKESLSNSTIKVNIALEIMNSVSIKYLFHLIKDLYKSAMKIEIKWYYEKDDENMLEEGNYLESLLPKSKFKLIGVDDLRKICFN